MKYIIITLVALLMILSIIDCLLVKLYKHYETAYKQEHEKLLGIQEEYSKLVEAYKIKKNNKDKANEKIDNLHSGKLSADDILPKRKG